MNVALVERTRALALRIIRLYDAVPRRGAASVIRNQFVRSGTSIGAHVREAFRCRSDAEWLSKMQNALQELDETLYWLELLRDADIVSVRRLAPLLQELDELAAIFVTSIKTVKRRQTRAD